MQDDQLATLRQLREEVTRIGEAIDYAIAQRENRIAEVSAKERRRRFKLVAIPIGIGVAAAATRAWIARNAQTIAVAGTTGAIAVTGTLAVARGADDPAPDAARPAITAPGPTPPGKSPAPGKSRPPATPVPTPTTPPVLPLPSLPVPIPPVGTTPPVPVKPPKIPPVHPAPGGPHGHGEPDGDEMGSAQEPCRIHLLGMDLLCGRLVG